MEIPLFARFLVPVGKGGIVLMTGEVRYSRPLAYPADDTEVDIDALSLLFGVGVPL